MEDTTRGNLRKRILNDFKLFMTEIQVDQQLTQQTELISLQSFLPNAEES